jgi:hypothetical protein
MSKFINRKANTITQFERMPYGAYKALRTLAQDHNAEIVESENGFLTLTFDEVKIAENVAKKFRADYAQAHAAYVPKNEREPEPTQKPSASEKSKPSSSKKGKGSAKMTLDEFITSKPSCTREEAKAYGFKGTKAELRAKKVELGVR